MEVFKNYAYYYDMFYKDKRYAYEAEQIDSIIKKYGNNVQTVINFGCGTGKHDYELEKLGYKMHGVDLSKSMIEIARKNYKDCQKKYEIGDIRTYTTTEKYDAAISLFHVMSYQNQNEDIFNAFKSVAKCIKEEGLFIFDVWYGPGVLTDLPSLRVKEVDDSKYKITRIARPEMYDKKNVVDVNYEIFVIDKESNITSKIEETHSMRYFFEPELQILLSMSGFELIENIDCNTLQETSYNSWTSYFICKKLKQA